MTAPSSGDRANGYEAQATDENLPRPDPTRLTTQLVDRALSAFREVMEVRLKAMDTAIVLAAQRIDQMPGETDKARQIMRAEVDREIQALREVVETRLGALDKATVLVAEKSDTQRDAMLERFDVQGTALRSDIDRQMTSQREVIETRLLAMDKATELLAATVGRVPSDTDKQVNALRELLGARIDGMDRATKLLAETVDHIPTDTDRAVDAARAIIEAQLRNVQDTSLEKFLAIDGTFASNALALTAALAAQKEAAAEQNKSNTLAITKSEQATKETISANAAQTATGQTSLSREMADLKERLVRLEAGGVAVAGAHSERRLDMGQVISVLAVIAAVAAVLISAFHP
jgi:hypothetical protein